VSTETATGAMGRTLLDPTGEHAPDRRELSARLEGIEGRTIALLDISKARGDVYLDEVARLLEARGAQVELFRKPTFTKNAPIDLRHEIASKAHAVVEALAD
jgi:hypothetical protein